ncbi:MAG: restriction endonuclease subunit S, partial [Nitrospirae bacterium]|nr:restriction endonuclease subunit S [Nitrospirota bacterium]
MERKEEKVQDVKQEVGGEKVNWPSISIGHILVATQYGLSLPGVENGTMPIVGMKDIKGGQVVIDPSVRVTLTDEQADSYKLKKGDILLNRTNSPDLVGKSGIVYKDEDAVFASYIVRLTVDRAKADPEFVNYCMNSNAGQRQIKALSTRAISQANINPTTFKQHFHIPLPPVIVQEYIAAALRTWDTAIEKTERLVEAKEKRFSWLVNRLIKKGNLKGKWQRVKLGEVAEIKKGQQLNVVNMVDTGKYYVLNGGIEPSGFT